MDISCTYMDTVNSRYKHISWTSQRMRITDLWCERDVLYVRKEFGAEGCRLIKEICRSHFQYHFLDALGSGWIRCVSVKSCLYRLSSKFPTFLSGVACVDRAYSAKPLFTALFYDNTLCSFAD